jgi:hypothetical protein
MNRPQPPRGYKRLGGGDEGERQGDKSQFRACGYDRRSDETEAILTPEARFCLGLTVVGIALFGVVMGLVAAQLHEVLR